MELTKAMVEEFTPVKALMVFMEMDEGRKVDLKEMKALTKEDREELGRLAKDVLLTYCGLMKL